ncbi:MAG: hypothetical protein HY794_12025 [Desulfarculus sp.]|nr:hypothetical protein [Desulfarculus sp.]
MASPGKLRHWLPRLLLLALAASLLTPLPRYLRGLTPEEYVVWLSQVVWVAGLALAVGLAAVLGLWWRRRGGRK